MPVIGIRLSVIPTFSITCTIQLPNKPNATRELNESLARDATRITRRKRRRKSASATVTPRKPSSSPTTAKMKSVCCSGRKAPRFCVPSVNPFPSHPPDPIAICDWITWYPDACGSSEGSRKTRRRERWCGASLSQRIGASTPIATLVTMSTTPSTTYGLYQSTTAMRMRNHAPQSPVLNASRSEIAGDAASSNRRAETPAQKSMAKKIPTKTIPVPRSGCAMTRSHGTSTTSPGSQSSTSDRGGSRRAARTRASIRTTATFASSAGCPSRTPPIVSHPFMLDAVPPPLPKSSVTSSNAMASRYAGQLTHSMRRTDARLRIHAATSATANHPNCRL